jgi:hypothetical protein
MDGANSEFKPVELYLQSAVVSGTLVTKHERISDHFNLIVGYEGISLKDPRATDFNGNPLPVTPTEFFVHKPEVLLIADLSEKAAGDKGGLKLERIIKESWRVLVSVGPFWLRGNIHLVPGNTLESFFAVKNQFIPMTDATLLKPVESKAGTFLINQAKIGVLNVIEG